MTSQPVIMTRDEALAALLTNNDLSDVTLRGSDGAMVAANRCLLAVRSPVFHRMLYGKFAEASDPVVDLKYDGAVLNSIVQYIYTDHVAALEKKNKDNETPSDIHWIQFLVDLVKAADYFALPGLRPMVGGLAEEQMKKNHDFAALVLSVCPPGCDETKVLRDGALDSVALNPEIVVNGSKEVVAMIHSSHIETILKNRNIPMDERTCFQVLQAWATAEDGEGKIISNSEKSDRKRKAAEMVNHICLEDIDTEILSTIVLQSGLVSAQQISDVYKAQALRAREYYQKNYVRLRSKPVWKFSRRPILESGDILRCFGPNDNTVVLDCPIMKSGIHKWSIKVLDCDGSLLQLGVASIVTRINSKKFLGDQPGCFAYVSNGESFSTLGGEGGQGPCNVEFDDIPLPKFSKGSTVSFILDLEKSGGILMASIDGGKPFKLFTGLLEKAVGLGGFVPAASVCGDSRVGFLGFEESSPL